MDEEQGEQGAPLFPMKFAGFLSCIVDEEMQSLYDPDDKTRLFRVIGRGKVTMLHFWSSWCPPCRDELPEIAAFADQHRTLVDFVIVNHDKTRDAAIAFLADKRWMDNVPCYFDPGWKVENLFFGLQIPATVFFGPDGRAAGIWENGVFAPPLIVGPRRWQDGRYAELAKDVALGNERYKELENDFDIMPLRFILARLLVPEVKLVNIGGFEVSSRDFKDKVTIFHFWNPECRSSCETFPALASFAREHGDMVRLVPIIIAGSQGIEKTAAFVSQNSWAADFEWFVDSKNELWQKAWGSLHPGTLFLDREGKVVTLKENDVISHIMSGARPWTNSVYSEFVRDIFEGNDILKKHSQEEHK